MACNSDYYRQVGDAMLLARIVALVDRASRGRWRSTRPGCGIRLPDWGISLLMPTAVSI